MEARSCTNCGNELHEGDWVSKSGLCRKCAERAFLQSKPTIFNKHWLAILLMCLFGGFLGIHRFAVGKLGSGIVYLLTGGLFGIGVIVDFILIASERFTEQQGEVIKVMIPNDLYRQPSAEIKVTEQATGLVTSEAESMGAPEVKEEYEKYRFRIAGVTFANEDGSSRQTYLKEFEQAIEIGDDLSLSYDIDTFDGKPRVRISIDNKCVGAIDASEVKKFIRIVDKIENAWPTIGTIESDDGETIYYCYLEARCLK